MQAAVRFTTTIALDLPLLLLRLLPVVQAIEPGNQERISSEFSHRLTGQTSENHRVFSWRSPTSAEQAPGQQLLRDAEQR